MKIFFSIHKHILENEADTFKPYLINIISNFME